MSAMNEITIFRLNWGVGNMNDRENWYRPRQYGLMYKTNLKGKEAAEEAFVLTNAPEEVLTEEQKDILAEQNFKGPSLSVGDVVRVESVVTRRMPQYFICKSFGWEEYDGDRFKLLKFLG